VLALQRGLELAEWAAVATTTTTTTTTTQCVVIKRDQTGEVRRGRKRV
jgi:hypothetical protein